LPETGIRLAKAYGTKIAISNNHRGRVEESQNIKGFVARIAIPRFIGRPVLDGFGTDPDGESSPSFERGVILAPVADAVRSFLFHRKKSIPRHCIRNSSFGFVQQSRIDIYIRNFAANAVAAQSRAAGGCSQTSFLYLLQAIRAYKLDFIRLEAVIRFKRVSLLCSLTSRSHRCLQRNP
jgi:hypothetical protein